MLAVMMTCPRHLCTATRMRRVYKTLIANGKVACERHTDCLVLIAVVSVHHSLYHAQHDATGEEDVDDVEEEIMVQAERADAVAS